MPISPLQQALQDVPSSIKSWTGSDKTVRFIANLNEMLGLKQERRRIVPRLILRLIVKDLHPAEFINTLSQELQIGPESARTIAAEVKEHVLLPIQPALDEWDVDIDLIDTAHAGTLQRVVPQEPEKREVEGAEEEMGERTEPAAEESSRPEPPVSGSPKPFVLHTEESEALTPEPAAPGATPPRKRLSLSSLGGGFFGNVPKEADATPSARVNIPEKPRVVHYREHQAPVGDVGDDQGFIDLSTIESRRGAKDVRPKVEGNTIDLRAEDDE